ncbi:MAG: MFS transporter, partial [Acidobacteria bacterium]|nr:MFS transporter [Acidobacteriota bacterium]
MVLPFLVLYLTRALGYSAAGAGRILGLYGLGALAGSYLGGRLCDLMPPQRVLLLSLSLGGVTFLLLGQLRHPLAIAATVFTLAVLSEGFRPALATALVEASSPGERSRAFVLNRLAINLGMSFGPAMGGFLALHNYHWLFWVDGATSLLAAAILAKAYHAAGQRAKPAPVPATAVAASPWADGPFLVLSVLMVLYGLVFFQLIGAFPLTLRDRFGLAENWIGISLAVNTLVICLFEMVLVHSLRRRDPYRVIGLGSLLMCLGFALLPLGTGRLFVIFTVLVWTVGEMLSLALVSGVVAERAGEASQGRYMGIHSVSFSVAFVLAPLGGTWVYQRFGAEVLWYGCGALGLFLWGAFTILGSFAGNRSASQLRATS